MSEIFGGETFAEQKEYLNSRGIDDLTTKKLGLEIVGPTRLKELDFKHKAGVQRAILFPIYTLGGEVGGYGARLFYQKTFGKDSRAKFLHPPSVSAKPPSLYFSPLSNWEYLEYGQRILICESYIKANIAAKLGFHAIGVSGCWGWSHNQELHWAMQELDWRGKRLVPVLCMDSDVHTESVKLSGVIKHFQAKTEAVLGVKAEMLTLPASPGGDKWGLDDYYMEHGEAATREFLSQEAEPIASELDAHLAQMNNEVVYVHEAHKFMDMKRNNMMSRDQFENGSFANRKSQVDEKKVKVAKVWTEWDKRNEVDTLRYKPGEEQLIRSEDESYYNLWQGWGCEPVAADCSLFIEWLEDAFPTERDRNYFCDWWSYQLQYPGVKLNTALMLVGPSGVGKGWMAHIVGRVFGHRNTWKCNLSDLESRFNSGLGASQICVIEEADIAGGIKVYNTLKDLITNEHIRYERKGVDAIQIDNCLNIFMNSNHIDVLQIDEFDRRFAVLEITNESIANDKAYWDPRWLWTEDNGGDAAIHGYLRSRVISPSFDPKGEAPWSQAKSDMVESTHHPRDRWVNDHVKRGEEIIIHGTLIEGGLMSAKELAWCYEEGRIPFGDIERKHSMAMQKALSNARADLANYGKKIKYQGLPTKYYWLGSPGKEDYYQEQLADRVTLTRLLTDGSQRVASEKGAGYPSDEKKY